MKQILKLLAAAIILQSIASCAILDQLNAPKNNPLAPIDYLERAPKMDVKNFFSGDLDGFAIITNPQGKIENSFVAKINGKWEENRGTVQYNYIYNGGKKDSRTWLITINDSTSYSAIGHDFIETAQGRNQGNASVVNYSLNTIFKDVKQRIDYEDKLYLVDDKSAIIVSTMRSGNKIVGEAVISLKKN
jgi:hypothetical protein